MACEAREAAELESNRFRQQLIVAYPSDIERINKIFDEPEDVLLSDDELDEAVPLTADEGAMDSVLAAIRQFGLSVEDL